jgi:hypothetical protein
MIVKKYIFKETGVEHKPTDFWRKWPDGSDMSVKEYSEQRPDLWKIQEVEVMTDQERQEIFDFAKELLRSSCMGVNLMDANYAMDQAKQIYNLKKTI